MAAGIGSLIKVNTFKYTTLYTTPPQKKSDKAEKDSKQLYLFTSVP